MEKLRTQRYAESLERVIQNNRNYLKGIMDDFQTKCSVVASIKNAPPRVVIEIPETYRTIQGRLNEIKAIRQLLRAKYFLYARKDPIRDKEISDLEYAAKAAYFKFEVSQEQIEDRGQLTSKELALPCGIGRKEGPFLFFRCEDNQVKFVRNWRILNELDYDISPSKVEERREVNKDKPRSLTLFVFRGNPQFIDDLQSRLRLREHDVAERYGTDELRGILAHLREVHPAEVERVFERYKESKGYANLRCLLIPIRSQKDYEGDITSSIGKILQEMTEGQIKTFPG